MPAANELLIAAQIATPIVVGAVGWLVKRSIAGIDARQDKTEERVERLELNSVGKEDWLRESGRIAQRQDKMIEDLAELKGQSQASVITAAVAAVIKRQEEGQ
jgi:hypothetical protein